MTDALMNRLVAEIRAAILVLNQPHGGGHNIPPSHADERARGIVQGLAFNYRIEERHPVVRNIDWNDGRIS